MSPESWWDGLALAVIGLGCAALIGRRLLRLIRGAPPGGCGSCCGGGCGGGPRPPCPGQEKK